MSAASPIEGGCLCRRLRYSIDAAPLAARACWCRLCQYLGAGSGTVNVVFPSDALTLTGEIRWHGAMADSGTAMQRGFCPHCGTPIFSNAQSRPHLTFIRAGTLDDPDLIAPQQTIWTAQAPRWACFDPALPALDGQPPPVA